MQRLASSEPAKANNGPALPLSALITFFSSRLYCEWGLTPMANNFRRKQSDPNNYLHLSESRRTTRDWLFSNEFIDRALMVSQEHKLLVSPGNPPK